MAASSIIEPYSRTINVSNAGTHSMDAVPLQEPSPRKRSSSSSSIENKEQQGTTRNEHSPGIQMPFTSVFEPSVCVLHRCSHACLATHQAACMKSRWPSSPGPRATLSSWACPYAHLASFTTHLGRPAAMLPRHRLDRGQRSVTCSFAAAAINRLLSGML